MHNQIRDMGRQIVAQENLSDVHMHSRIWKREDLLSVLLGRKGIQNTRGIILNCDNKFEWIKSLQSIDWTQFCESPNLTSAITYLLEIKERDQHDEGRDSEVVKTTSLGVLMNLRLLQLANVKLNLLNLINLLF